MLQYTVVSETNGEQEEVKGFRHANSVNLYFSAPYS